MKKGLGLCLISLFAFLPACAPTEATILQHPNTLQTVECKRNPWKNWTWEDEEVRRKCAEKYKALGFVEANENNAKGASHTNDKNASLAEKLRELNEAYEKGLLTEKEYKTKRKQIVERF